MQLGLVHLIAFLMWFFFEKGENVFLMKKRLIIGLIIKRLNFITPQYF